MKGFRIFIFIGILMCISSNSYAQTNVIKFEVYSYNHFLFNGTHAFASLRSTFHLKQLENNFFIPTFNSLPTNLKFEAPVQGVSQSFVFKSPIHYTAFFCKMEVKTSNALGIMIKVHAGDYDGYTGRYNCIRQ